jgi:hypothetical protein
LRHAKSQRQNWRLKMAWQQATSIPFRGEKKASLRPTEISEWDGMEL